MPVIKTERLLLEKAELNDASFFLKLLNSPNWIEFIGDRGVHSINDAEKYIQESLIKSYKENGYGLYKLLLRKEKSAIGICGIIKRPTLENPDIGFAILPEYTKQGYAYEAASATMKYAKSVLLLETILAITTEKNTNSKKLLEKIGLKFKETKTFEKGGESFLLYSNEY